MIREKFADLLDHPEIPRSAALAVDAESVISTVCKYFGLSPTDLLKSRRGLENLHKDIAIYLVRNLCRMTLPEVGQVFGITNYSSVSSAIQRVKSKNTPDDILSKNLAEIKEIVVKSQKRT